MPTLKVALLTIILATISTFSVIAQERTITLDEDVFLSEAQIVANDDYLGIFDYLQRRFLLFDNRTGKFLSEINASDSFPGFNWAPIFPKLLQNEMFFANSAPWGVYISYDNEVTHVAGRKFLATMPFDFIHDSLFVGFYTQPNGEYGLRGVGRDGEPVLTFDTIELDFPRLADRSLRNNQMLYHRERIYFIPAFTNTMYVFNLKGELEQTITVEIDGFVKPRRDLQNSRTFNIRDFEQVAKGRSTGWGLYALNKDELLITGSNPNSGYVVTRVNIEDYTAKSKMVESSAFPKFAWNNKLYFIDVESEPIVIKERSISEYWNEL